MKEKLSSCFKAEDDHLPPLKTLSVIAFALLVASTPFFAFNSGTGQYIREYLGLVWHLSMFFLSINSLLRNEARKPELTGLY